ncbi:MAG: cytochrome c biogenesis protein CcdA [Rikenellaceae bacterium]
MKGLFRIFSLIAMLVLSLSASAQESFVHWSSSIEQTEEDQYQIVVRADIAEGYHIYDLAPYGGYNPTVVTFIPSAGVELVGDVTLLTPPKRYFDPTFEREMGSFYQVAQFAQSVKLVEPSGQVRVEIEWMSCTETTCIPPEEAELTINLGEVVEVVQTAQVAPTTPTTDSSSMWGVIIEAILWGFAALLTPCVFPMIPMTVSFFMKGEGGASAGRFKALLYGLFIVGLYTLPIAAIIIITRMLGGDAITADIFNWLATHWLPNIIFFAVFMIFAASFFGAFEIVLPSWMVNKSDQKADRNSLGGIFFLALTLVLVSFSCTGPIVGSVLIKSTSGEFWSPIITMLAFSAAFALPFALFAFFPSTLKSLPKSGGWLNSVKVVLGFVELALGMKFLSVADQTYHWGLLDREIYLAIWIVIFSLLGLYLLGKLKFAHDSQVSHLSVGRLALSIVTFSFVVYMIPGMWGAPLKGLSGYLPPMHTQDFVVGQGAAAQSPTPIEMQSAKYSDFLHLPHNLDGFFDMSEAEAYAAKVGKPLFVDITGHGCVNCREMESRVWSDPRVLQLLRDNYVVVALYTDDKTVLDKQGWVTTDSGKVLKSLGKINSNYALKTYGVNAQPYYIIQDSDGTQLNAPRGYNLDTEQFVQFLQEGIAAFEKNK